MPGKRSGSEFAHWRELRVVEEGGIAGLRRGASVEAVRVGATPARRIGEALARLFGSDTPPPLRYPDAQCLVVEVLVGQERMQCRFDTADLPDAAHDLLALLPGLGPLPRG